MFGLLQRFFRVFRVVRGKKGIDGARGAPYPDWQNSVVLIREFTPALTL